MHAFRPVTKLLVPVSLWALLGVGCTATVKTDDAAADETDHILDQRAAVQDSINAAQQLVNDSLQEIEHEKMHAAEEKNGGAKPPVVERFVRPQDYADLLRRRNEETVTNIQKMRSNFVKSSEEKELELSFYTNTLINARALAAALHEKGYTMAARQSTEDASLFLVQGHTCKMKMGTQLLKEWTVEMCVLGNAHDCAFEGWEAEGAPEH